MRMKVKPYEIRTPQKGIKIGHRTVSNGEIIMLVKAGKQQDHISAKQLIEALYGIEVDRIVFKGNTTIDEQLG